MESAYRAYLKGQEDMKKKAKLILKYNDGKQWLNTTSTRQYSIRKDDVNGAEYYWPNIDVFSFNFTCYNCFKSLLFFTQKWNSLIYRIRKYF